MHLKLVVDNSKKIQVVELYSKPYEGIYSIEAFNALKNKVSYMVSCKFNFSLIYIDKDEYLSNNVIKLEGKCQR